MIVLVSFVKTNISGKKTSHARDNNLEITQSFSINHNSHISNSNSNINCTKNINISRHAQSNNISNSRYCSINRIIIIIVVII